MARTSWTQADGEAFDAIADVLVQCAGDIENRYPLGGLTAADRELLVDGFDRDEIRGEALLQRWARAIGSRPDIRSVDPAHRSLQVFKRKGAANRRARVAAQENALAVAEASMHRRNRASARGVPQGIDAETMINSGSPSLMAAGFLLRDRAGRLWRDDFHKSIRLDWSGGYDTAPTPPRDLDDDAIGRIMMWLRSINDDLGSASSTALEDGIRWAADADHRNEPADWLGSLKWDGVERLPGMLHRIFKAPDTEFNRAVGANLMIGLVARILNPGCKLDTMVVLRGGQGINKSTACLELGGRWYAQSHANVDSKDFVQELRGLMVLEVAELHSFLATRQGSARIKAMLSVQEDRYRPVWGRTVQKFPRTLVLIGTTNDRTFHNDPTGGRRFWIVDVGDLIDLETLRAEREQLFAEAVHRYKAGASWWEVPERERDDLLESATATSYFQERLEPIIYDQRAYDGTNEGEVIVGGIRHMIRPLAPSLETSADGIPADWGSLITLHRAAHWLGLSPRDVETGQLRNRLTETLRAMGYESYRLMVEPDRRIIRAWLKFRPPGLRIERAWRGGSQDDMPF